MPLLLNFTQNVVNAALKQGGRGPLLTGERTTLQGRGPLFTNFSKSGRFYRLILVNLTNFSKSGGIPAGFSWFLFNYWKVLHGILKSFFTFFRGPKIASEDPSLEPTLFPHSSILKSWKAGCGTATLTVWGVTSFYVKSDRLQPKSGVFWFHAKSS